MRHSIAALAVIRRRQNGQNQWLVQWNRNWNAYALIGGHKRPEETFRECVIREVQEELGLDEIELTVGDEPLAHLEYSAWSESAKQETVYTIQLFELKLIDGAAQSTVNADGNNRWLTEEEIQSGQTGDGRSVSPTMIRILNELKRE